MDMESYDEDADVLAERIIQDLKNTFKKDPLIDEFDILPVSESVCNKCPVIHLEHKVALESWCVRHVYLYVYENFMKWKHHSRKIDPSVLLCWTSTILLINPDIETAWNARKQLIRSSRHSTNKELKFSEIVLSRKPKSSQIFAHRKWIIAELMKDNLSQCTLQQLLERELFVCTQTANKYSNNYYSWNHRLWVIEKLTRFCSQIILDELSTSQTWVSTHVSDHSGFHYRQFLLTSFISHNSETCPLHKQCFSEDIEYDFQHCNKNISGETEKHNKIYYSLLMNELSFLSDLQYSFPGHETLWNHRRFVIHCIVNFHISAKVSSVINKLPAHPTQGNNISNKKYKFETNCYATKFWNLANEESFITSCLRNAESNTWEKCLISRHQNWLEKFVCQTQ